MAEINKVVAGLGASVEVPLQPVTSWTGVDLSGPAFFPGWLLAEDDLLLEVGKVTCAALWDQVPQVDVWKFSIISTLVNYKGVTWLNFLNLTKLNIECGLNRRLFRCHNNHFIIRVIISWSDSGRITCNKCTSIAS